jgi:hypothetical protein
MKFIIFFVVLAFCSPAFGQSNARNTRHDSGYTHFLCDAEDTDGICEGATGDTYANIGSYEFINVFFAETGAAGAECNVYAGDIDTVMAADMSAYPRLKINSVALSATQDAIGFRGGWEWVWVSCTGIGDTVTITVRGNVGKQRDKR